MTFNLSRSNSKYLLVGHIEWVIRFSSFKCELRLLVNLLKRVEHQTLNYPDSTHSYLLLIINDSNLKLSKFEHQYWSDSKSDDEFGL